MSSVDQRLIVVTGAGGFIGSHIALALAGQGRRVVYCDYCAPETRPSYFEGTAFAAEVHPDDLHGWLAGRAGQIGAVVHMGAISDTTVTDIARLDRCNLRFTLDLWHLAARHGWTFLYASSAATYGDGTGGFSDMRDLAGLEALQPLNPYGWSKHNADRTILGELSQGGSAPPVWAGFKFFNVFGPHEEHKGAMRSLVPQIVPAILRGEPVRLFRSYRPDIADGEQRRDFVYVKDAIVPVLRALDQRRLEGLYNVGTGAARTFKELACATFAALGRPPVIEYVDAPPQVRAHYQYLTQATTAKSSAAGLHVCAWPLERAIGDYVAYLRQGGQDDGSHDDG